VVLNLFLGLIHTDASINCKGSVFNKKQFSYSAAKSAKNARINPSWLRLRGGSNPENSTSIPPILETPSFNSTTVLQEIDDPDENSTTVPLAEHDPLESSDSTPLVVDHQIENQDSAMVTMENGFDGVCSSAEASNDSYKKALLRTILVVLSAVAFGLGTMVMKGKQSGLEFFAGYLVEQSLSVDNLFVFIMLFEYFKVPPAYQGRVLTWGIIGAVSMRAVMIVVGVAAIQKFRGVILAFAAILLVSSIKLLTEKEEEGDLSDNLILKISKFFVKSSDKYDNEKFFTQVDGKKVATPLLLCLVCIELSDFVFAVDSIPAVLGVSKDTFIVYSSNVFAIMALRSLYTLVNNAITDLPYLKPSVALVLGFVGIKMILEYFHYEISIGVSLSVVAVLLFGGVFASVWENGRKKEQDSDANRTSPKI